MIWVIISLILGLCLIAFLAEKLLPQWFEDLRKGHEEDLFDE